MLPKSTMDKLAIDSSQPNLTAQSCIGTCTDKVWKGWRDTCGFLQAQQTTFVLEISFWEKTWRLPSATSLALKFYCSLFKITLKKIEHTSSLWQSSSFAFVQRRKIKVLWWVFLLIRADTIFRGGTKGLSGRRKARWLVVETHAEHVPVSPAGAPPGCVQGTPLFLHMDVFSLQPEPADWQPQVFRQRHRRPQRHLPLSARPLPGVPHSCAG